MLDKCSEVERLLLVGFLDALPTQIHATDFAAVL